MHEMIDDGPVSDTPASDAPSVLRSNLPILASKVECKGSDCGQYIDIAMIRRGGNAYFPSWVCKCNNIRVVRTTFGMAICRVKDVTMYDYSMDESEWDNVIRLPDEENEIEQIAGEYAGGDGGK